MCSIFGSAYPGSKYVSGPVPRYPAHRLRVRGMLEAMKHRGPDEQQVVTRHHFSLGLARLSIVDRDAPDAHQPYVSKKETITAFNGELYNYRALDSSASEVRLLAEMINSHHDIRQYLDGDYAVAHYDSSLSRLTLYRDRFGVCPLYYQLRPWVEVSSEARRLKNPREVPAHGRVVIDVRARKELSCDWLPLYGATSAPLKLATFVDLLIQACVSRALHTEGSFSLALSGGLDSSLIAAALWEGGIYPYACITTAFSAKSDDLLHARLLAERLKLRLREVQIPDPVPESEQRLLIEHLDDNKPLTALRYQGALRSWFVAKYSDTRVLLCGDGGDELLGGYPCHKPSRFSNVVYAASRKRLSTLRSMQHFNLDRTNKMGMAHSREFRAPLLASTLSQVLLSSPYEPGKALLRRALSYLGMHEIAARESKYSADELRVALPSFVLDGANKGGDKTHEQLTDTATQQRGRSGIR